MRRREFITLLGAALEFGKGAGHLKHELAGRRGRWHRYRAAR
jgi:hypothetical protein